MNDTPIFEINNYLVHKHACPEELGEGRYSNYDVINSDTGLIEMTTSTFVQAVSIAMELFNAEETLNKKLHEMTLSEAGSNVVPLGSKKTIH